MKRSTVVTLVLAGSAAAVGLSSCKPRAERYASVADCEAAGKHTAAECIDAFAAAQREHESLAPHFQSQADCVARYGPGDCQEQHPNGGGSFFVPVMLGYMMGSSLGYHPLYHGRDCGSGLAGPNGQCYSGFSGGSSGGGHVGGFGGGSGSTGASDSGTVARGGFGAAGHGAGGGE